MLNRKRPRPFDYNNETIFDYQYIEDGNDEKENVVCKNNHIYFYCGVNKRTCLQLNLKIKEITSTLLHNKDNFIKKDQYIYLHINSNGGGVFASLSTIDTIVNNPIPIVSIIEGAAASAATLISVVCDHRIIMPNSYMLIHELSSLAWGKYKDIKDEVENLDELMNKIKEIYKNHCSFNKKKLEEFLKHDLWWNPETCLKYSLVDEIYNGSKLYDLDSSKIDLQ